jgi:hypothetical protein
MGATTFQNTVTAGTAAEAFNRAHEDALWEHGHGGYSGTIAEKGGYVEFPLPSGVTADEFARALNESYPYWDGQVEVKPTDPEWAARYPRWREAVRVFDDKWGPCVAFPGDKPGTWVLTGWASC